VPDVDRESDVAAGAHLPAQVIMPRRLAPGQPFLFLLFGLKKAQKHDALGALIVSDRTSYAAKA
jgi:hypothetical protein